MMWQVVGEQHDLSECITLLLYYIIPLNPCLLTGESFRFLFDLLMLVLTCLHALYRLTHPCFNKSRSAMLPFRTTTYLKANGSKCHVQKIMYDCNNIGKILLCFIFWYTVNKTSALWDHRDLCIFKLNFTTLVVFYASIKKQSYCVLRQIYDTFWCVLQQSLAKWDCARVLH